MTVEKKADEQVDDLAHLSPRQRQHELSRRMLEAAKAARAAAAQSTEIEADEAAETQEMTPPDTPDTGDDK